MNVKTNIIYKILLFFCFSLIVISFACYTNTFCLSGDDLPILDNSYKNFLYADHGNIFHVWIMYILNYKIPMIVNIHPQIFIRMINIYIYGIIFFFIFYNLCHSAFLFNKKKVSFPLYIALTALTFFVMGVNQDVTHGWWLRESCTFLRYSFAMLFLYTFWNYFIEKFLTNKIKKEQYIIVFILGILCSNASEYNAIISFTTIFLILSFYFFFKNRYRKMFNFLISAIFGIITGIIFIVINPGFFNAFFYKIDHASPTNNIYSFFSVFFHSNFFNIDIVFVLTYVCLLYLISKFFKKQTFNKTAIIFCSQFIACNIFLFVLYIKSTNDLYHGDIRFLFIGTLTYIFYFLFGLVIRKIKSKKIYCSIVFIILLGLSIILSKYYQITKESINHIREANRHESIYLKNLEIDFLQQYNLGKDPIKLQFDPSGPIWFRKNYIYNFIPMLYKEIDPNSRKIEWIEIDNNENQF